MFISWHLRYLRWDASNYFISPSKINYHLGEIVFVPSSGKTTCLKASKLGEVLAKKVECVRKATEKQSKAGEMRGHKRRTCSVLPLLRSSQNCNANYIHRRVAFVNGGGKGM